MLPIRNKIVPPKSSVMEDFINLEIRLATSLHRGSSFKYVAGVDLVYNRDETVAYVAAVILGTSNWAKISEQKVEVPVSMPYQADLQAWREGPLLLEALSQLPLVPDLILVHGNGSAHPRKFGLASYVGWSLDIPTVGVSKLWPPGCTKAQVTLSGLRGSKTALLLESNKDKVGFEVYLQDKMKPVYVSPGNRLSTEEAVSLVLRSSLWNPWPQPLLAASKSAMEFKEEKETK